MYIICKTIKLNAKQKCTLFYAQFLEIKCFFIYSDCLEILKTSKL